MRRLPLPSELARRYSCVLYAEESGQIRRDITARLDGLAWVGPARLGRNDPFPDEWRNSRSNVDSALLVARPLKSHVRGFHATVGENRNECDRVGGEYADKEPGRASDCVDIQ